MQEGDLDVFARLISLVGFWFVLEISGNQALGLTANKVFFEFLPNGIYRVSLLYTVPALKELREAKVEFRNKKEAEGFYWDLVRGADFSIDRHTERTFIDPPLVADPW
jgi:hypothetical protein